MKVLFYNHTGMVSGAERVLLMILNGIDRQRYEPVVVCPAESRMMELAGQAGIRTRATEELRARFTWRLDKAAQYLFSFYQVIRNTRRIVIEEAPAFIHANSIRAGLVMTAATLGLDVPVIWHAHDILPRHPLSTAVRIFAALTSRNHILAVSHAVASRFRGIVLRPLKHRVPITVIHNSVDLGRFYPDPDANPVIRQRLNVGATQPLIGIIGQLTARKGQLELIDAFSHIVRENHDDALLLIVGSALFNRDEDYAQALRRRTAELDLEERVRFLGSRDDVPELVRALDVSVVNSHEEPFGLTVLEALASGTATISTNVGGTPEMIDHLSNGILVESGDCGALVKAMRTLLRHPKLRRRLGARGRLTAVERFSTPRFIQDVNSLYHRVSQPSAFPAHKTIGGLEVKLSAD
jgi:L-malate glycosyltransferase